MYKLLSSEELGSHLYMKRRGATTIWETWTDGGSSKSHSVFGACCRQLFEGFLGIRQEQGASAYERVIIKPYLPENMNYIWGTVMTPKGRIAVTLERRDGNVMATVDIPGGVSAVFCGNTGDIEICAGETVFALDD